MGIDLSCERPLSLAEATRAVPALDGKRPHISTLWRWCRRGLRGVHLEYARLGHRVCTSREALSRFANRLAELDAEDAPQSAAPPAKPRTDKHRQRAIERADSELTRAGILGVE